MAATSSMRGSPSGVAAVVIAGPSRVGFAPPREQGQGGGVSDEEAESSDDDYNSQGEESE